MFDVWTNWLVSLSTGTAALNFCPDNSSSIQQACLAAISRENFPLISRSSSGHRFVNSCLRKSIVGRAEGESRQAWVGCWGASQVPHWLWRLWLVLSVESLGNWRLIPTIVYRKGIYSFCSIGLPSAEASLPIATLFGWHETDSEWRVSDGKQAPRQTTNCLHKSRNAH